MKITAEPIKRGGLTADQLSDLYYWRNRAHRLVAQAAAVGIVITIDNPPNKPLAMGNYDLVVSARVRRSK